MTQAASGQRPAAIAGRPEHTDDVDHSGTWHVQLQGTKTWYIRPLEDADGWEGETPVLAEGDENVVGPPSDGKGKGKGSVPRRLQIKATAGDLLVINTRLWWHRTEIEAQRAEHGAGVSMSYARDFRFDGDGEGGTATGKTNDSRLHPALFASHDMESGQIALREEDIPECQLPHSAKPNCELAMVEIDGSEQTALLALRDIAEGEVLSVAPEDGDAYEEWELDPVTGEVVKVDGE